MSGVTRITALIALVALTLAAACGTDDEDATPTASGGGSSSTATATEAPMPGQPDLSGTAWLLAAIGSADIDLQVPITLSFGDGQIGGFSGCNEYGGAYTASESGDFIVSELSQTDMACEIGMDLEADYLDALQQAEHYRVIEDQRLELADGNGETLLVFSLDGRDALDGTSWNVTKIDGESTIDGTDVNFTLRGSEITGEGGCNQFGGAYSAAEEGAFSVSQMSWTEMGCLEPEGVLDQEQAFFTALGETASYRHDPDKNVLTLIDDDGQTRIVAGEASEESEIGMFGSPGWVLASLHGREVEAEPPVTVRFDASQFAGKAGCLSYSGVIETEPEGTITRVSGTPDEMACDDAEEQSELAGDYIEAFEEAARYRLSGNRLEMLDKAGAVLLNYRLAETDSELEGSLWTLTSLNGEPVIADSEVTAEFSDGYILGSGGCNGYGSPYIVSELGAMSIPPPAMTAMLCEDPQGVMDQETAFNQALGNVRGYRINETSLELLDAGGEVLLLFERAR